MNAVVLMLSYKPVLPDIPPFDILMADVSLKEQFRVKSDYISGYIKWRHLTCLMTH